MHFNSNTSSFFHWNVIIHPQHINNKFIFNFSKSMDLIFMMLRGRISFSLSLTASPSATRDGFNCIFLERFLKLVRFLCDNRSDRFFSRKKSFWLRCGNWVWTLTAITSLWRDYSFGQTIRRLPLMTGKWRTSMWVNESESFAASVISLPSSNLQWIALAHFACVFLAFKFVNNMKFFMATRDEIRS